MLFRSSQKKTEGFSKFLQCYDLSTGVLSEINSFMALFDYTVTAILSQISPTDGDLHPLTFYSRGMAPVELNYKIYDKERLAIFDAFQQW